jgi:hypothetical protein
VARNAELERLEKLKRRGFSGFDPSRVPDMDRAGSPCAEDVLLPTTIAAPDSAGPAPALSLKDDLPPPPGRAPADAGAAGKKSGSGSGVLGWMASTLGQAPPPAPQRHAPASPTRPLCSQRAAGGRAGSRFGLLRKGSLRAAGSLSRRRACRHRANAAVAACACRRRADAAATARRDRGCSISRRHCACETCPRAPSAAAAAATAAAGLARRTAHTRTCGSRRASGSSEHRRSGGKAACGLGTARGPSAGRSCKLVRLPQGRERRQRVRRRLARCGVPSRPGCSTDPHT